MTRSLDVCGEPAPRGGPGERDEHNPVGLARCRYVAGPARGRAPPRRDLPEPGRGGRLGVPERARLRAVRDQGPGLWRPRDGAVRLLAAGKPRRGVADRPGRGRAAATASRPNTTSSRRLWHAARRAAL